MRDQGMSLRLLDEDGAERVAVAILWLTYLFAIGYFLVISTRGG